MLHYLAPYPIRWMYAGCVAMGVMVAMSAGHALGRTWGWWQGRPLWLSVVEFGCVLVALGCWGIGEWVRHHPSLK